MGIKIDKELIISRIKSHYGFKSDAELARFLGIASNTLANWHKRNTINLDLILTKCEELNADWLLKGIGLPIRKYKEQPDDNFSVVNDIAEKYVNARIGEGDYQKDIEILVKIITIQEQTIKAQEKTIETLSLKKKR
ncbi:helix-turn-helix domain-containing protein [Pedobacter sp. KR3-3]|uniref:Helix-turn-helix domain-containing protein n=1 Tax=Pedobacter albus TaxID=3113905 RepID=A0ABU7I9F4_9SPHI|nr:helix-turn-helix domain-containing protein [Pedobacter sp. KR3-3]MEE1946112.1 helix-turn-helix domain-containing protein [Pedobacter sp. KR3-3]